MSTRSSPRLESRCHVEVCPGKMFMLLEFKATTVVSHRSERRKKHESIMGIMSG